MEMISTATPHPLRAAKLALGLTFLFGGVVLVLQSFGLLDQDFLWKAAPAVLILIGAGMEIDAARRGRFGCGLIPIGIGTWLLAGSYHLFHLSFETALPLGIVIVGAGLMIEGLLEGSQTREDRHGK